MTYTEEEVRQMLRDHIRTVHKRQKSAAYFWKTREQNVSRVLNGHTRPTQQMLNEIGVVKKVTVTYVKPEVPNEQTD